MITGAQIRAGRALLDWTSIELGQRAGVLPNTVIAFEGGKRRTEAETIDKLVQALQKGGVEFTATGVQMASPVYSFDGPNGYLDLLKEVLGSGVKSVVIQNADNRRSSPEVLALYRQMRQEGIEFRVTSEEGNDYLVLPVSCYRWIPKDYFKNQVTVIYGDRVAFSVNNDMGCKVIRDNGLAETMLSQFNFVWDQLKPLDIESTAHDRIP
jgi:transcriptional regulator with XRE-family HTH domain